VNASTSKVAQKLRTTSSGFTLIELMVTIAVLAIIVGIAAPNISSQLANQRVKSTAATFTSALKEARTESVIRRQEVTLSYKNNEKNVGVIEIKDGTSNPIASYQYDIKSEIKPDNKEITFRPNKTADSSKNGYTVCDSNTATTSIHINVSKLGIVSSQSGGSC